MPNIAADLAPLRAEVADVVDPATLAKFDAAVARREAADDARELLAQAYRRLLDASPAGERGEAAEWTSTARAYIGLAVVAIGQAGR